MFGIITGKILLRSDLEAFSAVARAKVVDMAVMDARLCLFSVDGLATYRIQIVGRRNPAQTIGGLSPLVPGFLSVVTGGAVSKTSNRLKALWLSICFVLGFSVIFVTLGASASLLGQWLMAFGRKPTWSLGY